MLPPPLAPEHRRPPFHPILPQALKIFCPRWSQPQTRPPRSGLATCAQRRFCAPRPREEPAGGGPLSRRGGGRACASCPGFLSPARSRSSSSLPRLLPPLHSALPPFQSGRAGCAHSAALALGLVSAAPSPKSEAFRDPERAREDSAPRALRKKGASPPLLSKAPFPCPFPFFFFVSLASQEEVAELLALAQNEDLS